MYLIKEDEEYKPLNSCIPASCDIYYADFVLDIDKSTKDDFLLIKILQKYVENVKKISCSSKNSSRKNSENIKNNTNTTNNTNNNGNNIDQ